MKNSQKGKPERIGSKGSQKRSPESLLVKVIIICLGSHAGVIYSVELKLASQRGFDSSLSHLAVDLCGKHSQVGS